MPTKPVLKESTYKSLVTRCANQSEEITKRFREIVNLYAGGNYPKAVSSLIENINNLYYSAYKASVTSFTEDSSKVKDVLKEVMSAKRALKKNPESAELKANLENATKALDESLLQNSSSIHRSANLLITSIKNLKEAMDELDKVVDEIKNAQNNTTETDGPGTDLVVYNEKPLQLDNSETSLVWVNPKEIIPNDDEVIAGDTGIVPVDVTAETGLTTTDDKEKDQVTEITDTSMGIRESELTTDGTTGGTDSDTQPGTHDDTRTQTQERQEEKQNTSDTQPKTPAQPEEKKQDEASQAQADAKGDEKADGKKTDEAKEKNKNIPNPDKGKEDKGGDNKPKQVPLVTTSLFFLIAVACFFLLIAGVTAPVVAPLLLGSAVMATYGSSMGTLYYSDKSPSKQNKADKTNNKEKDRKSQKTKDKAQIGEKDKDKGATRSQETTQEQRGTEQQTTQQNQPQTEESAEASTVVGNKIVADEQVDRLRSSVDQEQEMRTNPEKADEYRGALNDVAQAAQGIVPEGTDVSEFTEEYQDLAQKCVNFQTRYQVFQAAEKDLDEAARALEEATSELDAKDSKRNQQRVDEATTKLESAKQAYNEAYAPLMTSVDELAEASKKFERVQQEEQTSETRTESHQAGIATFAQTREQQTTEPKGRTAPKKPKQLGTSTSAETSQPQTEEQIKASNDAIVRALHESISKLKNKKQKSIDDFNEFNNEMANLLGKLKEPLSKEQTEIVQVALKFNESFIKLDDYSRQSFVLRGQIEELTLNNADGSNNETITKLNKKNAELEAKCGEELKTTTFPTLSELYEKTNAYTAKQNAIVERDA